MLELGRLSGGEQNNDGIWRTLRGSGPTQEVIRPAQGFTMLRSMQELKNFTIGATDGEIGHVTDCFFDDEVANDHDKLDK
jgi:hypothetical protein